MNSPYSILVLRGARMHRFVLPRERLRQLLLTALLLFAVCGWLLTRYFDAQRQEIDGVIADGQAQIAKLSILRARAREVEETLSRWKALRQNIRASLPQRRKSSFEDHEGEELRRVLAALQAELKQMIAALPSGLPVKGRVVSGVGMRPSPWTGELQYHAGLDIPNPIGTPVRASGDAFVESIDGPRGTVTLDHGQEIQTRYAHLSKILVRPGQRVRKGQLIGRVGNRGKSTGPHLHYEVRVAGVAVDPRQSLAGLKQAE